MWQREWSLKGFAMTYTQLPIILKIDPVSKAANNGQESQLNEMREN